MPQPIILIVYSHKDEKEKDRLLIHLGILQWQGLVGLWSDDRIDAGTDWKQEIREALAQARVAILLISTSFLNSGFILEKVIPGLLKRHKDRDFIVLPVLIKPCMWKEVDWLTKMRIRPENGRPIWRADKLRVDEELATIAEEVLAIVEPMPKQEKDLPTSVSELSMRPILYKKELLRVDAAVPDKVAVNLAFSLAVAIRQVSSPTLSEEGLQTVTSRDIEIQRFRFQRYSNLRIEVSAPDCEIHGEASHSFHLYENQDSPVLHFQLTPRKQGTIDIIVKVYQTDDWLGSTRVCTLAYGQIVGAVQLETTSNEIEQENPLRIAQRKLPTIFVSYSKEDEREKDQLLSHLSVLQRASLIKVWSDDQTGVGADWKQEIDIAIDQTNIAILLITANYLSSELILEEEVRKLLQYRQTNSLLIISVIAKYCAWLPVKWLKQTIVRPWGGGLPVWGDGGNHADEDLAEIVMEIAAICSGKPYLPRRMRGLIP